MDLAEAVAWCHKTYCTIAFSVESVRVSLWDHEAQRPRDFEAETFTEVATKAKRWLDELR